jgi:hypothetical protein
MATSDEVCQPPFPEMDASGTVDIRQIESNLALTPAERLRRHDEWLRFIRAAHQAFKDRHGIDPADLIEQL